MIKEWLAEYKPLNTGQANQALREIMKEIALAGLARSGFFEKAAFYGGTALRIFHDFPRFSEDLDFSLLTPDPEFELQPFLDGMHTEFTALGIDVRVTKKELVLKDIIPQERTGPMPDIRIKLEVDTRPPQGFTTEENLVIRPYSFYVRCFSLPDLFAGKMHALLFRKWKNRVKGRDWFDLEWYIKKGVPLNLGHLRNRAADSRDWDKKKMTRVQLMDLLTKKINSVSFNNIRVDIIRFIPDTKQLDIWSARYFTDLIQKLKTIEN